MMSRDCNLSAYLKGYLQELRRFNRKRLEKCLVKKRQPYQPKPIAVESVDPNRARPYCLCSLSSMFIFFLSQKENYVAAKSRIQDLEEQLAVELQKR